MDCQEYRELISAHVDGALSSVESISAQTHLDRCARCLQVYLWETKATQALKEKLSLLPARAGLRIKVLEQIDGSRREGFFGWSYMAHGLVGACALLLILAVPYLFWRGEIRGDIYKDAIGRYQQVAQGTMRASRKGSSFTLTARLLDLSPWGYNILSQQTEQIKGQEERIFVYRGEGNEYLLAQEFDGSGFSPPAGSQIVKGPGREFVSYSDAGVNLVAWQEKDFLCVLTSTLPQEKLLGLARSVVLNS